MRKGFGTKSAPIRESDPSRTKPVLLDSVLVRDGPAPVGKRGLDELLGIKPAPAYRIGLSDGGKGTSKRPRQSDDCTVRAMALAFALPYDEAYDLLALAGRQCGRGFTFRSYLDGREWALKLEKCKDWNIADTVNWLAPGLYFIFIKGHVFVLRDGIVYDSWTPSPEKQVEAIYLLSPKKFCSSSVAVDTIFAKLGL